MNKRRDDMHTRFIHPFIHELFLVYKFKFENIQQIDNRSSYQSSATHAPHDLLLSIHIISFDNELRDDKYIIMGSGLSKYCGRQKLQKYPSNRKKIKRVLSQWAELLSYEKY